MTGENHHAASVVSDQLGKPAADLDRGVPVVCQGQDGAGILAPHPYQVCDAMHQHPGLAGAGAGEDEHVRPLPAVRYNPSLDGVVQALGYACQDSGVVWRAVSLSRSGSQRRRKSSWPMLK